MKRILQECIRRAPSRQNFWIRFVNTMKVKKMAEVGIYRGEYASELLHACEGIERYYMIDPWRHLVDWNKPANDDDKLFQRFFEEAVARTDFAAEKRIVLRGRTVEVVDEIAEAELDLLYIDGDHTLRGIAIDLICSYSKVRTGGWIGGDDFGDTIWQHSLRYEPSLVFPFAVYFAEAVGAVIFGLPHAQFLIHKDERSGFAFHDLVGCYKDITLREQLFPGVIFRQKIQEALSFVPLFTDRFRSWFLHRFSMSKFLCPDFLRNYSKGKSPRRW